MSEEPYRCKEIGLDYCGFHSAQQIILHYRGEVSLDEKRLAVLSDELRQYGETVEEIGDYFEEHLKNCDNCSSQYEEESWLTKLIIENREEIRKDYDLAKLLEFAEEEKP